MDSVKSVSVRPVCLLVGAFLALSAVDDVVADIVIAAMDPDGSNIEVIAEEPEPGMNCNGSPRWSNDGTRIVFDSITPGFNWGRAKIFVVVVEGAKKSAFVDLGYGIAPVWSPDDNLIAFCINPGNPMDAKTGVWVMNADGTGREWLCDGWCPRFSPKGDRLVFTEHFHSGRVRLYDMATGKIETVVGAALGATSRISWSPDGEQLAVFAGGPAARAITTIDVRSSSIGTIDLWPNKTSRPRVEPDWPVWSPDGEQILFAIEDRTKTVANLCLIDIHSGKPHTQLTKAAPGHRFLNPSWSPDGKRIVCAVVRPRDSELQ